MKRILLAGMLLAAFGCFVMPKAAHATIDSSVVYHLFHWEGSSWVEYFPGNSMPASGNLWKYEYVVTNDATATSSIVWWHTSFPSDLGYSLVSHGGPTGWATITETRSWGWWSKWSAYTGDGGSGSNYYIDPGESRSGYWVEFNWAGTTLPGDQHYQAANNDSESGRTTPVPEPASVTLLGLGVLGLFGLKRRKV